MEVRAGLHSAPLRPLTLTLALALALALTRTRTRTLALTRCERDFTQHRADMMSSVMRLYAPFSTYLIPLDADEMLAVSAKDSLAWSAADLSAALAALPEAAKMFKVSTLSPNPNP